MPNNNEPMIKLEPDGKAPILSYNVPEPTSYSGRNFIELEFPPYYFNQEVSKEPSDAEKTRMKERILDRLSGPEYIKVGEFRDERTHSYAAAIDLADVSAASIQKERRSTLNGVVENFKKEGKKVNLRRNMLGTVVPVVVPEPTNVRPRLLLIETFRLSSFLGNYGAGRTIKTFSLLPGEKTRISIETYTKRETDAKSASSMLDSYTQESADDFETSVQSEQSTKDTFAENFEYNAEANAEAGWGWGKAKVSGGVKEGTNSAREEFAKNISSATEKHAMKASAKRDVQINTSYGVKEETGMKTSIEREIENINVSRTLNFVFRQMNQEFITLLHLVDVRVAYFNGFAESKREVTLPELDSLLGEVIAKEGTSTPRRRDAEALPGDEQEVSLPEELVSTDGGIEPSSIEREIVVNIREEVRKAIIDQLENIFDYKDQHHSFVEEKPLKDRNDNDVDVANSAYLRLKKDYTSTYIDDATGTEITVPGIILSAKKYTLRTEGVIVEALLGQGNALDEYSRNLQNETIEKAKLENDLAELQIKREQLAQKIVSDKDEQMATIYNMLFDNLKNSDDKEGIV